VQNRSNGPGSAPPEDPQTRSLPALAANAAAVVAVMPAVVGLVLVVATRYPELSPYHGDFPGGGAEDGLASEPFLDPGVLPGRPVAEGSRPLAGDAEPGSVLRRPTACAVRAAEP